MEYIVDQAVEKIDFGATGVNEVLQNVRMILKTPSFSCPMSRDFAWIPDMLDAPINIAQARIKASLAEAIQKYEPRAEVTNINFETKALDGSLKPIVRVRIDETTL